MDRLKLDHLTADPPADRPKPTVHFDIFWSAKAADVAASLKLSWLWGLGAVKA